MLRIQFQTVPVTGSVNSLPVQEWAIAPETREPGMFWSQKPSEKSMTRARGTCQRPGSASPSYSGSDAGIVTGMTVLTPSPRRFSTATAT